MTNPAVTESLRERLMDLNGSAWSQREVLEMAWKLVEGELQKRPEGKAQLVGEFRRLAAECEVRAEDEGILDQIEQLTLAAAWNRAAQMLEESKP